MFVRQMRFLCQNPVSVDRKENKWNFDTRNLFRVSFLWSKASLECIKHIRIRCLKIGCPTDGRTRNVYKYKEEKMKTVRLWILYFLVMSVCFCSVNHAFAGKETMIYKEYPEGDYGFTVQVHNHLGESVEGISFQLYGSHESTVPLSYLQRQYEKNETVDTTYVKTTTSRNGQLHFYGLEEGVYYLKEVEVPEEYQVLKERIRICVNEESTKEGIDYYIVNGERKKIK